MTLAAAGATATALVFGLGADYSGRWQTVFYLLLLLAGLLLLAASAFGWWVAKVRDYEQPDLDEFQRLLLEGWEDGAEKLRVYIATGILAAAQAARAVNDMKAKALDRAFACLVLGVLCVAAVLAIVVLDRTLV
jgi:MFS family permease